MKEVILFIPKVFIDLKEFDRLVNNALLKRKPLVNTKNVSPIFKAGSHPFDANNERVALAFESMNALNHIVTFCVSATAEVFDRQGRFPLTITDLGFKLGTNRDNYTFLQKPFFPLFLVC